MLSSLSLAQKNLCEEDSSGSDAESELSLEPETDRFGFILTNGSPAGSVGPSPELVRQRETKWINIILQWDHMLLKKTNKVKVQCQKGIPASLRAKCWPLLCAASDRMKQNKDLYQTLDSQPALQTWVDVIERDLGRQFPFHEMFLCKDGHGQRGLFRVLKTYTQFQPEEGYCQAQGPVAAVLLMNMPAEEAFWCLVQISEQYLPGYYSPLLEGVLFDAGMLTWVLRRTCPAAHKHLQHHGVEPLMFATDWLMCLFTRHLPFNTLLRVWDLFFCNGVRVLLQVAVVLVRRVLGRAEQRKQCQGQMETLERLRGVREEVHEEDDTFIAEVCSVPLSARDLEKQTEKELEKWRRDKPSSTFDPRGRCHGYLMAWARAQQNNEDLDKKEKKKGNLSVPLSRSASTLSLSPSFFRKRLRKGGKVNTGEGGAKVVRHFSMGAKEDWRSWNELHFKKVQGVQEEDDADEPKKEDQIQNIQTDQKETEKVKELNDQAETGITEMEGNQPKKAEEDKMPSSQKKETNIETEPNQGPTKDQSVESILQPNECTSHHEQEKMLGYQSQSPVLEQQTLKDVEKESDRPVLESEHSAAGEENWRETQADVVADTYTDREMETDSSEEQTIQDELKQEDETERKPELQTQVDTVSEVLQIGTETIPGSDTESTTEAATFSDSNTTLETETKETENTETDKIEVFKENHHSTESLTERVEEHVATQSEIESEPAHIDSKTESKTETVIMSLPECTHQQVDTESEAEMPVTGDTMEELQQVFTHCSATECDRGATEPTEEKETISTVHSEFDNNTAQAEETQTETTDSAAPAVKEETSEQAKEEDLITEPGEITSSVEDSYSEAPAVKEETSEQAKDHLITEPGGKTSSVEDSYSEAPAVKEETSEQVKEENLITEPGGETSSVEDSYSVAPAVKEETSKQAKEEDLFTEPGGETSSVEDSYSVAPAVKEETSKQAKEEDLFTEPGGKTNPEEDSYSVALAVKETSKQAKEEDLTTEPGGKTNPVEDSYSVALAVKEETSVQVKEEDLITESGGETNPVEDSYSVAPAVKETSKQAKEEDLITESGGETNPVEDSYSVAPAVKEETSVETSSVENSFPEESVHKEPASQLTTNSSEVEKLSENVQEDPAREDNLTSFPKVTDNVHTDSNPQRHDKNDVPAEQDNSELTQNCRCCSGQSSEDFCVCRSSSSHGSRLALSNDLFTAPQETSQPQSISDQAEVKQTESQSHPGAVNTTQTSPKVTESSKVTLFLSTEVTEGKVAEQEPPAVSKRFGLFRRLRGEKPKKAKGKEAHKMQVPTILIQDFSDGTGKLVEEVCEDKLSSRERRRKRRERERKEKEEERLRKKNDKETKERERRKPQTRGKSFQVQKRDNKDPQLAKTGSQTLRSSASYAESYF
ncbi:protein split ends [Solea solea]|uniref:protein split ends n=1 Tax=Solea solea TaxID=90069 RepID=UPI00272D92D9|nr:protein split ends [Solea solea]